MAIGALNKLSREQLKKLLATPIPLSALPISNLLGMPPQRSRDTIEFPVTEQVLPAVHRDQRFSYTTIEIAREWTGLRSKRPPRT